jgi:hypothetical protein
VADESDAAVEAFEAAVAEAESDRVEDAGAVAADRARELDERLESRSGCPGQPGVQMRQRERSIVDQVRRDE